jgi:hypothetical protein
MSFCKVALFIYALCFLTLTNSYATESSTQEAPFSFMNTLAKEGLHDFKDERWNAYGQLTYIENWKNGFPAAYTNLNGSPNSLLSHSENGFTGTATFYVGLKTWQGGELYVVPEIISEKPLSGLKGLGGVIQNFELQKNGAAIPILYRSRFFFKQTINLGGEKIHIDSAPMQLDSTVDSKRLVFRIGNFSILDFFDPNSFASNLRRQFNNMAFMTHAAYDFAADARGYTDGAVLEYDDYDWTVRFAHIVAPKNPNQLRLDFRLFKYFGDQIELEHRHVLYHQAGAVRLLAYRNRENMGSWTDALAALQADPNQNATTCTDFNYESDNATAPDLCWARKANIKMGIGINIEQQLADDIGVFFRGMYSDGKTEVYSYTSTDRSISLGGLVKGARWDRQKDTLGIGYAENWISKQHADYLNAGGVDGFIGDGKINQKSEKAVELFYSLNVISAMWLTADYQHLINPAFNRDRGPVNVFAVKAHLEF